ncbi:NAD-binding protein [Arcobacteraceae bacterium]|nr:NAD-binding protein [Arcobacteraceae bacterium]
MSSNKIIIYSFSKLAIQIASILYHKGYEIIIIEEDLALAKEAKRLGYEVKKISLMDDKNIMSLEMNTNIKAFFCVSDNKNNNLFVTLSVRNLNPNLKIISVSFVTLDNKTMLLAGANKIINPYEIGALRIFRLLNKPYILDILDNILFSESTIEVSEITIQKNSILDGIYLKSTNMIEENNLILLGIQDKEIQDKFIFYSSGINHKIDYGDTIVLLGKHKDLQNFTLLLNNNN